MDLISNIKARKADIYRQANIKEKLLYNYVRDEIQVFDISNLGEIEKVCAAVLCKTSTDISSQILKLQSSKPIRNLHYSYDLTSVCAVSLGSTDKDIETLKAFYNSHGLKEKYILQKLFPNEFSLIDASISNDPIEKILVEALIELKTVIEPNLFLKSLEQASDLIDIIIIEDVVSQLMKFHPDAQLAVDARVLRSEISKCITKNSNWINFTINSTIILFAILFIIVLSFFAIENWNFLEPLAFVISVATVLCGFLYWLLLHKRINYKQILDTVKANLLRWFLKMIGINYEKVKSHLRE